ncbi:MFS transporter [Acidilobus sp.]|uniref:MFS transporter n=1 Tax=Acidilobus sp. TaxID=1872109 RepID=UPI003D01E07E
MERASRSPYVILADLTLVTMLTMYVEAMVIPSLPRIQSALAATNEEAAWVVTAYLVVGAAVAPLFGKMGDVYGKKRLYMIALSFYSTAVLTAGFAPNIFALIAARAVQGFGFTLFPLGLSIITDTFPRRLVAVAQGILSAMVAIGMTIGMIAGAYIEEYLGWRAMFHIAFGLSIVMLVASLIVLESYPPVSHERIDYASTVLLSLGTALVLLYLTEAPYRGWITIAQLPLLITGVALYLSFFIYETRSTRTLIRLDLLKQRNVMVANIAGLVSGVAMFMLYLGVIYFAEESPPYGLGLSVIGAAMSLLPATLAMIVISPLVGHATSTLGPKPVLIYGSLVSTIGFLLFVVNRSGPLQLAIDSFVTGVGIVSIMVPIVNMIAVSVPADSVTVSLEFNTMVRFLGSSVGPVLAATLLTTYRAHLPFEFSGRLFMFSEGSGVAFNYIFYIGALASLATLVISLFTKNYVLRQRRNITAI